MEKYRCDNCGWVYDSSSEPEPRVNPEFYAMGIPDDFACMGCGGPKEEFRKIIDE